MWNKNIKLFNLLKLFYEEKKFYFCNLDLNRRLNIKINRVCLKYYNKGNCLENDLYLTKEYLLNCSFAKSNSIKKSQNHIKSIKLKFKCPNSGTTIDNCSNEERDWKCYNCQKDLQYFDFKFYCGCGEGSYDTYSFKCSECFEFKEHDNEDFKNLLKQIENKV